MAEIALLGGTGFIGSHVAEELSSRGHEVRVAARHEPQSASPDATRPAFSFVKASMDDVRSLIDAFSGFDQVVHLAATTNPTTSAADPVSDVEENVNGSLRVLDACVAAGVRRIVFASTGGAIYGHYPGRPLREDDPTLPVSPYAIGKLATEGHLRFYRARHGLESLALRISNPYGPGQSASTGQGVIAAFVDAAVTGRPITVFGDGSMVRDYIHVGDAVRVIADLVERDVPFDAVNIGSGVQTSVRDILDAVEAAADKPLDVHYAPKRPSDVERVVLDTSRLSSLVNTGSMTQLREGIAATYAARRLRVEKGLSTS